MVLTPYGICSAVDRIYDIKRYAYFTTYLVIGVLMKRVTTLTKPDLHHVDIKCSKRGALKYNKLTRI